MDEYSLFYLKFIESSRTFGAGAWHTIASGQPYTSWSGYAFEAICLEHIPEIKRAPGISSVYTGASAWRYVPKKGESGVQVDLLLDRADQCINLCEMKFSASAFVITKLYVEELLNKGRVFQGETKAGRRCF